MKTKVYPKFGEMVRTIGNYSEVMMHFGLAGRPVGVMLLEPKYAGGSPSVQVYKDKVPFSGPITPGEGGFYRDENDRYYTYADDGPGDDDPQAVHNEVMAPIREALDRVGAKVITNLGL